MSRRTSGVGLQGLLFLLLVILLPAARLQAQTQLTAALRLAQDGRIDSARATLKRMELSTVPTDTLFPGILYSAALVSPTAEDVRQKLQRVIVEYPFSPWAEPALIALAQLDYANGDPAGAGKTLEKFRTDHATSSLYPVAALWGARAGFEVNNATVACQWVGEGLTRANSDASTRAELIAWSRRCPANAPSANGSPPAVAVAPPVQAQPAQTSAPLYVPDPVVRPTGTTAPATPVASPVDTVIKPPPATPVKPAPAPATTPPPVSVPDAYRVQIVAANSQEAADEMLDRAKQAGFKGIIVKDGGYFKVRLGEYATRAEANTAAAKVKARLGGSPFVVAP